MVSGHDAIQNIEMKAACGTGRGASFLIEREGRRGVCLWHEFICARVDGGHQHCTYRCGQAEWCTREADVRCVLHTRESRAQSRARVSATFTKKVPKVLSHQ